MHAYAIFVQHMQFGILHVHIYRIGNFHVHIYRIGNFGDNRSAHKTYYESLESQPDETF